MVAFVSDNVSGVHPRIMESLLQANRGYAMPYGNDDCSRQLDSVFSELFERDVFVLPCGTGTAANSLAMSLIAGPINSICLHEQAHMQVDECNAPEFFTGGAKLLPVAGLNNKLIPSDIEKAALTIGELHSPQPSAISVTQTTEIGGVYQLDEIAAISEVANNYKMALHMDGARFANAVAALNCSAAEASWKVGVDVLSFGATKNGCMAAEALLIFNQDLIKDARFRHKRAAQLQSKQRFISSQLSAYIANGLWLENARRANDMMRKLANGLENISGVCLPHSVESNLIFVRFTNSQIQALEQASLAGYVYDSGLMRICCSWATKEDEVERFIEVVENAPAQGE